MDFLFELLGEIVGGLYFGLAEIIVPDKNFTKAQRTALQTVCFLVMLGALAVLWAGIIYLVDGYGYTTGVIMTAVGGGLVAVHVALAVAVIVHDIRNKRKKLQSAKKAQKSLTEEEDGV